MSKSKIQRIPLEERLKKVKCLRTDFLSIFSVYVDDYWKALYEINGNAYFERAYKNAVDEAKETGYVLMARYITEADELPIDQESQRLYDILIEPFTIIKDFSLERGKENNE